MRKVTFKKIDSETWEARPFQGIQYKIVKRWLKGYVIYLNGKHIGSGTRLNEMKQIASEDLANDYVKLGSK
jgi:hypothetical protein